MKSKLNAKALKHDVVVLGQWSFFTLVLFFLLAAKPAWSAQYYVSTTGSDLNSGLTADLPFRSVQKAMNTVAAGDIVNIKGGVYRESITATRGGASGKMVTVQGYNGEVPVIKGSDVVTGWDLYSGAIWKKTNWAFNSQQVFVDFNDAKPSKPLQQIGMPSSYYSTYEYPKPVGSGVSGMVPGSFYYEAATKTLYVWLADASDPNTHYMEASTRSRLFYMSAPYIYLKGIAFRHSNSSAASKQGLAVELSSYSVVDQCDIQYMDFGGLSMGYLQTGAQALNSIVSNNGDAGINAPASYNFRVAGVTMNNNNYRNFNALWHAGGFKAASKAYGTVEFSEAGGNNGSGIWFDYTNSGNPIIVRNNYIHNNGPLEAGIFFEVANNGLIYNNLVANNGRRGIYIAASDNNRVHNNTVYGTSVYAGIELGGMPRSGATLTGNTVSNNIISHGTSKYDLFIATPNGTTIVANTSNYNNFYRPTSLIQLSNGTPYSSLLSWQNASKLDLNSLNVNPAFVNPTSPAAAADYALTSTSPLLDKGTTLAAVPQDYLKTARPTGAAYDMGAYEYVPVATASSTTTTTTSGKDTTAPTVVVSNPADGAYVKGSVAIASTATDNVGISSMSLYVDGVLKASANGGNIGYTWSTTGYRIGTHYIWISAIDAARNLTKITRKVVVQ